MKFFYIAFLTLFLTSCTTLELAKSSLLEVFSDDDPKGEYKVGKPYRVEGRWYYPQEDPYYIQEGSASWYGDYFHGRLTANGEKFNKHKITAAHRTLPLPSMVNVTNLDNGRTLLVRVNDRGPYAKSRILDLSEKAAETLGFKNKGHTDVRVEFNINETEKMLRAEGRNKALAKLQESYKTKGNNIQPNYEVAQKPLPQNQKQSPATEKGYFVQVGTFNQLENSKTLARKLQRYHKVRVAESHIDGMPIYRVQVGPYLQLSEADKMLNQIREVGYEDSVIISY